jgi:hypothetical protein
VNISSYIATYKKYNILEEKMIEKVKRLPFIEESEVVRIDLDAHIFERYDRTIRVIEKISSLIDLKGEGEIYTTAAELLPLLPLLKSISKHHDAAEVILTNGAKYMLPGREIKFEPDIQSDFEPENTFKLKLSGHLSATTLKNLLDPILQTIYIDPEGAVSTNSLNACLDSSINAPISLLIPPDLIELIAGTEVTVLLTSTTLLARTTEAVIKVPIIPVPETNNFLLVRGYVADLPETWDKTEGLEDSLKRLMAFGEYASFTNDKVYVGNNYEPFKFMNAETNTSYPIVDLLSMLPSVSKISCAGGNLLLKGNTHYFIISPKEGE